MSRPKFVRERYLDDDLDSWTGDHPFHDAHRLLGTVRRANRVDISKWVEPGETEPTATSDWEFSFTPLLWTVHSISAVPELRTEFDRLANRWLEETLVLSNLTYVHMHPAYQRIIGMGQPAIPLILGRLSEGIGHWFWALACIAGEDAAAGAQSMGEARSRWLEWGSGKGYIVTF